VFGPDAADVAYSLGALCPALIGLHRFTDAIAPAQRELAIRQRASSPDVLLAGAKADLGMALCLSKRDVQHGRALLLEARAIFVRMGRTIRVPEIDAALGAAK
jgi:hypothetical protein